MKLRGLKDEDFVNYKKPSMFLIFPNCSMKCGREVCQNVGLLDSDVIEVDIENLVQRYLGNEITSAIVCGGLEPFDSWIDLYDFVRGVREVSKDDIVIYSGYNKEEIVWQLEKLKEFENIVVKFGRYVPGYEKYYDKVLGVYLGSDNQFAERIS